MRNSRTTLRSTKKRATTLIKSGKPEEARELYFSICKTNPSDTESWLVLARLSQQLHAFKDAEYCARHVLSILPSSESAHIALGSAAQCLGHPNEARSAYQTALQINPESIEANYLLGGLLLEQGMPDAAIIYYKKILEPAPNHIEALNNLSAIYTNQGKVQESINLLEHALRLQPDGYHMLINLARSHLYSGNAAKAIDILKNVISLYPNAPDAHSKYLLCLNYVDHLDPHKITQEHNRWSDKHTRNLKPYKTFSNKLTKEKNIRVGYVSPDLKTHSVSYFIEPILAHHNKSELNITCYADFANPDNTSARLKAACDNWKITHGLSDTQLAELIHADEIDILVDLAGHTANNRLTVFARKPAPIQVSYLGYPNTTGLKEIDYRLTDPIADPTSASVFNTETLIRLPNGFLCYLPSAAAPGVSGRENIEITFGSFNNLAKVTNEVISAWSRILTAVPTSKLLLKSKATADPYTHSRIIKLFEENGINSDRLLLTGYIKDNAGHLVVYNDIDIALDTFPYNGTTTTCEALWMGTPVVTQAGNTHGSRVGASILSGLKMTEYIAHDTDEYVDIAIKLANDTARLSTLRESLRDSMRISPICNADLITRDIEAAYTEMWNKYCNSNAH